ncbi:hypothetical protein N0V93_009004 [Gnomoniopsis smithogilvyi]|uniref:Thioredoxin reductase n=1 Tax=Gnomoniopsis smithogilvyi TaxID=1191159 RepID=A0A9W9CTA2_9PEZI|nr:hypothetical protein N0V93_009004 [Gnomoniopsis smithogilvyi]
MTDLTDKFVSSIAQALNAAEVPCVLWGHCLLRVHGVPTIVASVDFVVPDDSLEIAAKTLTNTKLLSPCPDLSTCLASSPDRYTPPAAAHLHIDSSEVTVGIYTQSETLWFLPRLDISFPPDTQHKKLELPQQFCLASDRTILPPWRPGRGSGAFQSGYHPILVPKAHVLLEAFLRLYARDLGKKVGSFGMAMISYMEEYVDDDGLLDSDQLPEPLNTFYRDLRAGRMKSVGQWGHDLQKALGVPSEDCSSGRY